MQGYREAEKLVHGREIATVQNRERVALQEHAHNLKQFLRGRTPSFIFGQF